MKKSLLKQFIKEEIRSVLKESINEVSSSQAIEAGKDLIPIIKKWTAKDEDYLSFAYDKWQELLVKKYKIDPLVAIDIRNHLYSIHNRHNLDRLHNVAYGVIINLTESINESDNWKTVKTKSGDTLKPGKKYTMPRYDGEITFIRFDRDNKTMHLKSNKIGKIRTSIDNAKDMVLVESINEGFLADLPTWVWTLSYAAPFIWMTWEILVSGFEDGKLRRKLSPSGWVELIKLFLKKSKTKQIINTLSQDPEIKSMMGDVKSGKEKQWKLKNLLSKKMSDKQKDVVKQEFDSIAKRLLNKESINEGSSRIKDLLKNLEWALKYSKMKTTKPGYGAWAGPSTPPRELYDDHLRDINRYTYTKLSQELGIFQDIDKALDDKKMNPSAIDRIIKKVKASSTESVNEGEKEALLGDPKMDKAWAKKVDGLSKSQLQKEKDRLHKAGFGHGNQWSGSKENMIKFKYVDQLLKESVNEDFNSKVDMGEVGEKLKRLKKENPGKRISYDFISGGVVYKIDGKPINEDQFDEPINETKISRGIFKGYEKQKNKVLIPFISASDYNLTNSEMVNFTVGVGLELNKHIRFPHDDFYMWIINNKITALLTPRGKQRVEVNVEKGNYTFKDFISYFRSAVDTYINRTKNESINEDQFEASLADPKKYKMGTMWFKRWWKPKKGMDGWTWEDDGRYIWLTRPDMNRPTVRFEKDTGLLQGNWVDPKEMQWE